MKNVKKVLLSMALFASLLATNLQVLACDDSDCETCDCVKYGHYYAYWNPDGDVYSYDSWDSSSDMRKYIPEGATIRVEGGVDVYIVKYNNGKMYKRLVLNPDVFVNYRHLHWDDVMTVSQDVLDVYITSTLVQSEETGMVYRLYPSGDTGIKRMVEEDGCVWNEMDQDSIYLINGFDERSYRTASSLD
ncbi:MAG: hypothetical protein WCQ96_03870 [Patescibacteria group bacterium]